MKHDVGISFNSSNNKSAYMKKIQLGNTSEQISAIGQGTWGIKTWGSDEHYKKWCDALKIGVDAGMTMIDTAEFYGHGSSEKTVGKVIKQFDRDKLFIATKITPIHLYPKLIRRSCNRSLRRLDIKTIDLYQIHFPNPLSCLTKALRTLETLVDEGKIRYIGVSNFSPKRIEKAMGIMKSHEIVSNQIKISVESPNNMDKLYEFAKKNGVTLIAYSPFGHSGLKRLKPTLELALTTIADNHNVSKYQIALAWLINFEKTQAIPKSTSPSHIKANAAAAEIVLSSEEMNTINEQLDLNVRI